MANRRKGLATPGKGSTTKVKDYFGMAEEISGTGYELYHKTLGSAIDTAITHAKLISNHGPEEPLLLDKRHKLLT